MIEKANVWRKTGSTYDPKLKLISHGRGLLFFIDVTRNSSNRMTLEVYRNILSANLQRNVFYVIVRNLIVQQGSDPKHTANTAKDFTREDGGRL